MQQPEETCRRYKIEEGQAGLVVSLDRDQEDALIFPNSPSRSAQSAVAGSVNEQLVQFFKSLDYGFQDVHNSTLKMNFKSGDTSFSIYGVPAKDTMSKGEVFLQNQEGLDQDAPPVKLSPE